MSVIDFHTHILPGMDDGSRDIEMTKRMLELSAKQGVNVVAATPHFYADRMPVGGFLKRRAEAYDSVKQLAETHGIRLVLGAEAAFFRGMGDADGLERLTLAGTKLLLLEMPFRAWESGDVREVEKLLERGLKPVLAHTERFYPYQRDKKIFEELCALPVILQINAQALTRLRARRLVVRLIGEERDILLGSDCHNISSRPPNLAEGRKTIEKKIGGSYLERMDRLGEEALNG